MFSMERRRGRKSGHTKMCIRDRVYTAKVIFSTILEMGSEALLDPVLNQVKRGMAT